MHPSLTLGPGTTIDGNVYCHAVASSRGLAVATDDRLHIFDTANLAHLSTVHLACRADQLAVNTLQQFIAVGDCQGALTFISFTTLEPIYSAPLSTLVEDSLATKMAEHVNNLGDQAAFFQTIQFCPAEKQQEDIVLVFLERYLLRIHQLDLPCLEEAVTQQNIERIGELRRQLRVEVVDTHRLTTSFSIGAVQQALGLPKQCYSLSSALSTRFAVVGTGQAALSYLGYPLFETQPQNGSAHPRTVVLDQAVDIFVPSLLDSKASLGRSPSTHLTHLQADPAGRFLLALDSSGALLVLDSSTLVTILGYPNVGIRDFIVLPTTSASRISNPDTTFPGTPRCISDLQILALVDVAKGESPKPTAWELQVIQLAPWSVVFRSPMATTAWLPFLADLGDKATAVAYVVSQSSYAPLQSPEQGTSFCIQAVTIEDPTSRVQQLLRHRRFDEALELTAQHRLDSVVVHEARLMDRLVRMKQWLQSVEVSMWSPTFMLNATQQDQLAQASTVMSYDTIVNSLAHIKDPVLVAKFCQQCPLVYYQDTVRILHQARQNLELALPKSSSGKAAISDRASVQDDLSVEYAQLQHTLRRLGTWRLVHDLSGDGKTSGEPRVWFHPITWHRFRVCDLATEMKTYLTQGHYNAAMTIWGRHQNEPTIVAQLSEILTAVPDTCGVHQLAEWLRLEFLPALDSQVLRRTLHSWVEERAMILEMRDQRPHQALTLVQALQPSVATTGKPSSAGNDFFTPGTFTTHTLLRLGGNNLLLSGPHEGTSAETAVTLENPSSLLDQLEDLCYLWDTHHYCLSLQEYGERSPSAIAVELLDRIASAELLPDAIQHRLLPYAQRHALDPNEILVEYCLGAMDQGGTLLAGAPWESRALVVLNHIDRTDAKLKVVLELMRRTPIPWSADVDQVVRDTLELVHDLRQGDEIREQYRLMRLRKMLLTYGIKTFNISNMSLAKSLVQYITSQVDIPTAMSDALQVVRAYHHLHASEAYLLRLQTLVNRGTADQVRSLLASMVTQGKTSSLPAAVVAAEGDRMVDEGLDIKVRRMVFISHHVLGWLVDELEESKQTQTEVTYSSVSPAIQQRFTRWVEMGGAITQFVASFFSDSPLSLSTTGLVDEDMLRIPDLTARGEQFQILHDVFHEFNYCLTISDVATEDAKRHTARILLGYRIREARERMTELDPTAYYGWVQKLAQMLHCDLPVVKALLAEQAVISGHLSVALNLCHELAQQEDQERMGPVLRSIAQRMAQTLADNPHYLLDEDSRTNCRHIVERICQIVRQTTWGCNAEQLPDCLDECHSWQLLMDVFQETEHGTYQQITQSASQRPASASPFTSSSPFLAGLGASTAVPGSSSFTMSTNNPFAVSSTSSSTGKSPGNGIGATNLYPVSASTIRYPHRPPIVTEPQFGRDLFADNFCERGLVLNTEEALTNALAVVRDISIHKSSLDQLLTHAPLNPISSKSAGKGTAATMETPVVVSMDRFCQFLHQHRHLGLAIRLLHQAFAYHTRLHCKALAYVSRADHAQTLDLLLPDLDSSLDDHWRQLVAPQQLHNLATQLLPHVFSTPRVDLPLALGYLTLLPLETGHTMFRNSVQNTTDDYTRAIRCASVGIAYALVWRQRSILVSCQELAANARWWQQLNLLQIPFERRLFSSSTNLNPEKRFEHHYSLLAPLLLKTQLDLPTALEFASAYQLEEDMVLLQYLRVLLLSPLGSKLYSDEDTRTQFMVASQQITHSERLLDLLSTTVLPRLSPYDYERLRLVLEYLQANNADEYARKGVIVLETLQSYTRMHPPLLDELVEAYQTTYDPSLVLDGEPVGDSEPEQDYLLRHFPLANKRLPFHALMAHSWEVLRAELHESTIPRLLPLAIPLGIPADDIYTHVAYEMLNRMKQAYPTVGESRTTGSNSTPHDSSHRFPARPDFIPLNFADIKNIILRIRNYEVAISVAKYVADALPVGPEKLHALRTAYQLSERVYHKHVGRQGGNVVGAEAERAETAVTKLREYYLTTDTECQLVERGLDQYTPLIGDPLRLLQTLYEEQSEAALMKTCKFDIHSLVADIATRHDIDIDKFRDHLLTVWLQRPVKFSKEAEADFLPSTLYQMSLLDQVDPSERCIQRVILYMLRCFSVQSSVLRLLEFAYKEKSSKVSSLNRVRALSVLFQVASPTDINPIQNYDQVKEYLMALVYLGDFESLQITQSISDFISSRKDALTRSLWVNYHSLPKTAQLVCNLCLDYEIHDGTLLESVLQQLTFHQMFAYLARVLPAIASVPRLAAIGSLANIWMDTTVGLMCSALETRTSSEGLLSLGVLDKALAFCLKFPYPELLPMDHLVTRVAERAPLEWLLRIMTTLPEGSQLGLAVSARLATCSPSQVLEFLDYFHPRQNDPEQNCTDSSLFDATPILAILYNHLDQQQWYREVAPTRHVAPFVHYLIRNDRLASLVAFTVNEAQYDESREQAVKDLVRMYYAHHGTQRDLEHIRQQYPEWPHTELPPPDSSPREDPSVTDLSEKNRLELYLWVHNITPQFATDR
ncbi:hypothetical protein IWQ62_001575 [Dispira parvispora]|uniref:RZZ complex subunit KNTC1/ROD C-terminal domain-containing protein n=1 Tax=Dispira parvispora TaxID=1520584 RepID=A0A9W8AY14_9FUNG|nr:hypothetical protein IWQ62_001575 [Dispira parvispora]